jgi:hypothetical protein
MSTRFPEFSKEVQSHSSPTTGVVLLLVLVAALLLPLVLFFMKNPSQRTVSTASDTWMERSERPSSNLTTNTTIQPKLPSSAPTLDEKESTIDDETRETTLPNVSTNQWRCACAGGFLPPGMFGNVEAVFQMGTGQCFHKT